MKEKTRWNGISIRSGLSGFAIAAVFVPTLYATANLLADFFDEEGGATGRTGFVDGTIPQGIFARRILTAGKERTPFSRAFLDKIAATAWLGALHAER
jgi:hypothetical protein